MGKPDRKSSPENVSQTVEVEREGGEVVFFDRVTQSGSKTYVMENAAGNNWSRGNMREAFFPST